MPSTDASKSSKPNPKTRTSIDTNTQTVDEAEPFQNVFPSEQQTEILQETQLLFIEANEEGSETSLTVPIPILYYPAPILVDGTVDVGEVTPSFVNLDGDFTTIIFADAEEESLLPVIEAETAGSDIFAYINPSPSNQESVKFHEINEPLPEFAIVLNNEEENVESLESNTENTIELMSWAVDETDDFSFLNSNDKTEDPGIFIEDNNSILNQFIRYQSVQTAPHQFSESEN